MVRIARLVAVAALLFSAPLLGADPSSVPAGITYAGGDGLTVSTAVIITGGNDFTTTKAEYAWLHQHVPGAKVMNQSLFNADGHVFDKLRVTLSNGSQRSYFFDITSGFRTLD